jgi:bifunctional non-homologous end joining protein LigD
VPLLPERLEPMLCSSGAAFDAADHLFEVKWDGVRAMAYCEDGIRLAGRRRSDLAGRYPELAFLGELPAGTLLDGELIVLGDDGRPDFPAILGRENGTPAKAREQSRHRPVLFVVFDLLFDRGERLLAHPLRERRERLEAVVAAVGSPRLQLSEGVVGQGLAMFAAIRQRQLEGMVAKDLGSAYAPGERSKAWRKVKAVQAVHCLVLGFEPDEHGDFRSLIIATDFGEGLRCVGKVGSGISEAARTALRPLLLGRIAAKPLVPVDFAGVWIAPGLYCRVEFLERMPSGALRAPVFVGIVEGEAP